MRMIPCMNFHLSSVSASGLLCSGLCQLMNHESATELRLKPCGLRRHNVSAVGYVDDLLHGYGVERQCHSHLAAVHTVL